MSHTLRHVMHYFSFGNEKHSMILNGRRDSQSVVHTGFFSLSQSNKKMYKNTSQNFVQKFTNIHHSKTREHSAYTQLPSRGKEAYSLYTALSTFSRHYLCSQLNDTQYLNIDVEGQSMLHMEKNKIKHIHLMF